MNQIEDKIREDAEELGEDYGGEEEVGEVFPGAEDLDECGDWEEEVVFVGGEDEVSFVSGAFRLGVGHDHEHSDIDKPCSDHGHPYYCFFH